MGKFWLGFLVGLIAGVILTIVAVFAILSRDEPSLSPEVEMPGQVRIGEEFELRVVSQNPHETEVQLHSIDIDDAFLAAFDIMSIDPLPTDSMSLMFMDQYSYFFERDVPPGDSLVVTFTLLALEAGTHIGRLEVCNFAQVCFPVGLEVETLNGSP
jgi:hypothetical protein